MNHTTLKIGTQEIVIDSRFTLIQGTFKKDFLEGEQLKNFLKIIENMEYFPVELITEIFKGDTTEYEGLHKALGVLKYITNFKNIVDSSFKEFSNFCKNVDIFSQLTNHIHLLNKKENLKKEMEIAMLSNESSQLLAIKDLISKLMNSIKKNKKKLRYFEEDFQNTKNKVIDLENKIEILTNKTNELTQLKKDCFNQINKITRNMEGDLDKAKLDSIKKLGIDLNLTNSEKIRALQKKAKDAQFEVNQLNSTLDEAKDEYDKIKPEYESYMKDYQIIVQEISEDELKLDELKKEFEKKLINIKDYDFQDVDQKEIQSVRPIRAIKIEYNKISEEIKNSAIPEDIYNTETPMDLDTLLNDFKKIDVIITNNMKKYLIPSDETKLVGIMEALRRLNDLLNKLELIFNSFLIILNIETQFNLATRKNDEKLYLKISFYRKNKELVSWKDFTTPEKIFSVIGIFISLKMLLKYKFIIFSNLFLPTKYNKRGSIFRTINKILPLFENNKSLRDLNLIFVISNLEMKNDIESLKVITIKES